MSTILQLAPQNVWKHFYSLTQIPRPSGHMEKITKFLIDFGKGLGLESFTILQQIPLKPMLRVIG